MSWFTIERLDADSYAISEYGHWEETHSYLLLGSKRALLIDSGLGVGDMGALIRDLTSLPVLVALTHAHWDHIGGLKSFSVIAVHEAEAAWLKQFPLPLAAVKASLLHEPHSFPASFDPDAYTLFSGGASRLLTDGTVLDLGGRCLTALHTPGHSPGHCCFYETDRGTLYSGDLLYAGQLDAFYESTDPKLFAASVKRMRALAPACLRPAHFSLAVKPELIGRIDAAFDGLAKRGLVRHGSGTFPCGDFSIRL